MVDLLKMAHCTLASSLLAITRYAHTIQDSEDAGSKRKL